ncbi:MAG: hypothetical protein ACREOB_04555 [Thermodesulfobacteriota bacterium]
MGYEIRGTIKAVIDDNTCTFCRKSDGQKTTWDAFNISAPHRLLCRNRNNEIKCRCVFIPDEEEKD